MKKITSILLIITIIVSCLMCGCSQKGRRINNDDALVEEVTAFLKNIESNFAAPYIFAYKISLIKRDVAVPLYVEFDPCDYYYLCGYYYDIIPHEGSHYNFADKYIWVAFEDETKIQEYYCGSKMMVAFQINKASLTENVLSDDASTPNVEHYEKYTTEFKDGFNINPPLTIDASYILLNESKKDNIYHSASKHTHINNIIETTVLNNNLYIKAPIYYVDKDGSQVDLGLDDEFSIYYDTLMSLMEEERYTVYMDDGGYEVYGLISIDNIVNFVIKQESSQ